MIKRLSASQQFIATTFRSEFVEHADQYYGVTFGGKVSQVKIITHENAKDFVESQISWY